MSNPKNPIYTQKHFEDMAQFISQLNVVEINKYQLAQELASHFQSINAKFNVKRFFKACGLLMYSECVDTELNDGQPSLQQELETIEGLEQEIYGEE